MLCKKPFKQGVMEFGCGQCMPCRIDKRRMWATRLMLEARKHRACLFVTLTYNDENLPRGLYGPTLVPKHYQDFLKRYRLHFPPGAIRYYVCGEYGERRGRPHYHCALFGDDGPLMQRVLKDTWGKGNVDVRVLSWDLAWYIAGYICKRFTKFGGDQAVKWLAGRHPEFARMSLKPGIGALAMVDMAEALNNSDVAKWIGQNGDTPYIVNIGGRKLPIGRYLAGKLREEAGYPRECPEGMLKRKGIEMMSELGAFDTLLAQARLREMRESKRVQHSRNAEARHVISVTKRGVE